jgi:surfeit locus 1 family protein
MAHADEPRSRRGLFVALAVALAVAFAAFIALGVWQLQRMQWKHDLIARIEAHLSASPVVLPAPARWAGIDAKADEYRRVRVTGHYVPGAEARTQAVTDLGAGSWVLSALRTGQGGFVFVNRGFVPQGAKPAPAAEGPVVIVGLLRPSEPQGGFLRRNDAAADRWYSRDVDAIAHSRGLPPGLTPPFFIDAQADPARTGWPRAGMTVVHFRNTHLSYALTWFALAGLTAWAGRRLWRIERDRAGSTAHGQESDV